MKINEANVLNYFVGVFNTDEGVWNEVNEVPRYDRISFTKPI